MKFIHDSWPVGGTQTGWLKLDCPYSLSLRWRWKDRFHSLDAVAYGSLEVTRDGDRRN